MCNYVSISNRSIKGDLEHIQKGDLEEQKCGLLRWLRGKALVTKPEDVSSILRTHMMEGKKQFYALSSDSTHVLWHVCAPLNTYTSNSQVNAKNNNKNRSKTDKNLLGGGLWFSFIPKQEWLFLFSWDGVFPRLLSNSRPRWSSWLNLLSSLRLEINSPLPQRITLCGGRVLKWSRVQGFAHTAPALCPQPCESYFVK